MLHNCGILVEKASTDNVCHFFAFFLPYNSSVFGRSSHFVIRKW